MNFHTSMIPQILGWRALVLPVVVAAYLRANAGEAAPPKKTTQKSPIAVSDTDLGVRTALPLMDSAIPETRRRAAELLGAGDSEDSAKLLLTMLADSDASVRRSARDALVHFRGEQLNDAVISVLLGKDTRMVSGFDEAFPALREALEPGMLALLTGEHSSKVERSAAAFALGRMHGKLAVPILGEYARSKDPVLAVTCAQALYVIGDEGALHELIAFTDSPHREVRRAAIYGLVQIGGPEVLTKMTDIATGKSERDLGLRQETVRLIGYIGDWSVVEMLINMIRQQAGFARSASEALQTMTGLPVGGDNPYIWVDWYNDIKNQQKQSTDAQPPPLVPGEYRKGPVPGLPPEGFPFVP